MIPKMLGFRRTNMLLSDGFGAIAMFHSSVESLLLLRMQDLHQMFVFRPLILAFVRRGRVTGNLSSRRSPL